MDTTNLRTFFNKRRELAEKIVEQQGRDFEADGEIILCCAVGALAALLWPGEGLDRRRFVQLLVDFSDAPLNLKSISTPVLAWHLRKKGDVSTAIMLKQKFYPGQLNESPRLAEANRDESEVITAFPHIATSAMRRASFASLIYNDIRCGLVHEYDISAPMTTLNFLEDLSAPAYFNISIDSEPSRLHVHIPFKYLVGALQKVVDSLFTYWDHATTWIKPPPTSWWVNG